MSANLAIWADVLWELGGWSSENEAGGEDTELSWRAQLAGLRLGFAPDAVVYYRYRPGLWQTARQAYGIGVNCEHILHDYRFLRDGDRPGPPRGVAGPGDGDGSTLGRALGRTAWLATPAPLPRRLATPPRAVDLGRRRVPGAAHGCRPATGSSTGGAYEVSRSCPSHRLVRVRALRVSYGGQDSAGDVGGMR